MLHDSIHSLTSTCDISDFVCKEEEPLWARQDGSLTRKGEHSVTRADIIGFLSQHQAYTGVVPDRVDKLLAERGDLDFAVKVAHRRFRANLYWANNKKLTLVLRRLQDKAPPLQKLGLPAAYFELIKQSKGLLLVTGATGSGKTTTLAATVEHLNCMREGHIITLEDPIEYVIQSNRCLVDQRQIGRDATSFTLGLRAAMRQDPDVILVGELRDYDTVKTALDAANTGHLVLGTLHTNSAQQSIERLSSFFASDKRDWAHATLSQVLLGVVSQVLVPCKAGDGRVLAAELLVCTSDVRNSIREGKSHQIFNAMDTGSSRGHVVLNNVLKQLVKDGLINEDAALFSAYDPTTLRKELKHV